MFQDVTCEDADLKSNIEESISKLKLAMKDCLRNSTTNS